MFKRRLNQEDRTKLVLERCQILHMALFDEKGFFIQPVSYGYMMQNGETTLYFCGKKNGRKYPVYQSEPEIHVLVDRLSGYKIDEKQYTPCFESLSAQGKIEECFDRQKEVALTALLLHCGFDRNEIELDDILQDDTIAFYRIRLHDIVTKKSV